jgi:type IV secretion system protein VirB5
MTKRGTIAVVVAGLFAVYPLMTINGFASGIPVVDVANLGQSIQQVMHMVEQINQLKSQLAVAEQHIDRISGSRGMGDLLHTTYDLTVQVDESEILKNAGLKSAEATGLAGETAELYDEGNRNVALQLGQSEKSLQQAQARFSELSKLVAKVNHCPDPKDIMDLQARIEAENVLLQNEMVKLSMLQMQAQARDAAHRQKIRQMAIEATGEITPINW